MYISTWVNVKLAFHRFGNALQFDGLQGAVSVHSGGQAAQHLPDKPGHLSDGEDFQQFVVNRRKRPQEHRLDTRGSHTADQHTGMFS